MATAKEYNMLFRLQAQLGREFNSSFVAAQQAIQQTRSKIQELNKQQTDITAYQKQQTAVENTSRKLKDLQKEHDNIQREMKESESYSSALENKLIEKQRAIDNTTRALQRQTDKLNEQKNALQEAGVDTSKLGDESKRLSSEIETLTKREDELTKEAENYGNKGASAFELVGAALVASGIAAGLKAIYEAYGECVSIAGDFQETMSTVEALSGANANDMAALSEQAKELGATTKYTATEAAQAMTFMGMAGWNAQQMISGMDGVLSLAAASGEDLALTSDIVTDNLTAFGLKAEDTAHFADVLAAAATNSNTSVSVMGETFKQSASIAGALGYSIEDVSTAVGLMANAGVKGSIAGTALKNTFNGLLEGATISSAALGEVDISVLKADGTMKTFGETVEELRGYFSQMTEAERVNNAMAIAGQRGYNGLLAIVNSTDEDFQKLTASINDCDGAASKMAEIRMDNLNGQVTLMNSAMDALKTTIGEAYQDEFKGLAKVTTDILTNVNEFLQNNPVLLKALIAITGGITGVVGAYTAYVTIKKISNTLKQLSAALKAKETAATIAETAATEGATAATSSHAAALGVTKLSVLGLIGVVAGLGSLLMSELSPLWSASESVRELQQETENITNSVEESMSKHNAEMKLLEDKVELYDHLRNKQYLSAEQQKQLKDIADELQEVFGDEVQVVNSLTGEYNDLSGALDNYIEVQTKKVKMSSMEEAASQAYAQIDKIRSEMEDRSKIHADWEWGENVFDTDQFLGVNWGSLFDFQGKREEYIWIEDMKAYREEISKCQKVIDDYETALRGETETAEDNNDVTQKAIVVSKELNGAFMAVVGGYMDVATAAETYGVGEDQINSAIASAKAYQQTLKNAAVTVLTDYQSVEEAAEKYGLTVEAIDVAAKIQSSIEQIQILKERYDEVLDSAIKSVEGQYKLWDDAAEIVANDIDTINSSLVSQSEYWTTYNENITALAAKANEIEGLREIISTFADGSPESANMIAGLAKASDEELKKMVANWQEVQKEQLATSEGLAELITGANSNIGKLEEEMKKTVETLDIEDEAKSAAEASIDAYVKAIVDGTDGAVIAAERLSSLVSAALNPDIKPMSDKAIELAQKTSFVGPQLIELTGAYAKGTDGAKPGLALVGENGPELVTFAGGEKVFTAEETQTILREIYTNKDIEIINAYANGTGDFGALKTAIYNNGYNNSVQNSAVATSDMSIQTAVTNMDVINEAYSEFVSFIPLVSYIAKTMKIVNAMQEYTTNKAQIAESFSSVMPRGDGEGKNISISIAPTFNVEGGNGDIEAILRGFSEELIAEVMDALEEAEIDARRRVYK